MTNNAEHGEHLRLAVLSDIHGNARALESVIADVQRFRPDGLVLLGDLLADGPDPVGSLTLLRALPNAWFVQGNTDRYLADLNRAVPPRSAMPDLVAAWQWAADLLGEAGCRFLAGLPPEVVIETPAGPLLAAHGVPGDDEGFIDPTRADTWAGLDWHAARLLLVGHTHVPFVLDTGGGMVINPGSVGIPVSTGYRASYALLDLYRGGQTAVRHVQVTWDTAAYVAAFGEGIPLNRKAEPMIQALRQPLQPHVHICEERL